jgi:hypothetical protein
MNLMTAYGAPFHINLSSNSDLLPKTFRWTREDTSIKVFIDGAIPAGLDYQKKIGEKKVAWVCESRSVFYEWGIKKEIFNDPRNVRILEQGYDALFFSDREYCKQSPKFHYAMAGSNLPWCKNQQIFDKTKLVSMVYGELIVKANSMYLGVSCKILGFLMNQSLWPTQFDFVAPRLQNGIS